MSRHGNCYDYCYDNALPGTTHAESFWTRFIAELHDGGSFPGLAEAKLKGHHMVYYNTERRHSAIGFQLPNHSETHFQTRSQLCAT